MMADICDVCICPCFSSGLFCQGCFDKSGKEEMQVFWEDELAVVVKQEDYVCTDDDDESIMMNLQ